MKNKGHKSSNIFQTLKGSGAWQSKDGSKPMIKDVGIKSPLNMNQSLGKHYLSKGTDGNSPLNLGLGTITGGYLASKAVKKGAELVGKANATTDQEERYRLLGEAEKILIDELPIIPVYTYVRSYQLSPDVKGYYPNYLDHHHPKTLYLERD